MDFNTIKPIAIKIIKEVINGDILMASIGGSFLYGWFEDLSDIDILVITNNKNGSFHNIERDGFIFDIKEKPIERMKLLMNDLPPMFNIDNIRSPYQLFENKVEYLLDMVDYDKFLDSVSQNARNFYKMYIVGGRTEEKVYNVLTMSMMRFEFIRKNNTIFYPLNNIELAKKVLPNIFHYYELNNIAAMMKYNKLVMFHMYMKYGFLWEDYGLIITEDELDIIPDPIKKDSGCGC